GLRRLAALGELVEQVVRDVRDLGDGALERVARAIGRMRDARDLAHVLPGGRLDLFVVRGRLEAAELGDVPAHATTVDRAVGGRQGRGGLDARSAAPTAARPASGGSTGALGLLRDL